MSPDERKPLVSNQNDVSEKHDPISTNLESYSNSTSGLEKQDFSSNSETSLKISKTLFYTISLIIFILIIVSFLLGSYVGFLKPAENSSRESVAAQKKGDNLVGKVNNNSSGEIPQEEFVNNGTLDTDEEESEVTPALGKDVGNQEWERLILDDKSGIYLEYPDSWTPSLYSEISLLRQEQSARSPLGFSQQAFIVKLLKGDEEISFSLSFRPQTGITPYCTNEVKYTQLDDQIGDINHPYANGQTPMQGYGYIKNKDGSFTFLNQYEYASEICSNQDYDESAILIPAESISVFYLGDEVRIAGEAKEIYDRNIYSRFAFGDTVLTFEPGNMDKYYFMNIDYLD